MEERARRNPMWGVVEAAKKIESRQPKEEEPEEHQALLDALNKVSEKGQKEAVWRLMEQVVEEKAPVQGLYALTRELHMTPVATGTTALLKVIRAGATQEDLENSGLAQLRGGKHPHYIYRVGREAITEAAKHFREEGQIELAQVLEEHLRRGERKRKLARARREARKQEANSQ